MEKGLLMLTMSMLCLWLLLDEFFGGKKISAVAKNLTPVAEKDIPWKDDKQAQESKEDAKDALEKNPNINEDAKKGMDEMIDHFYGPGPS